MYPFIIDVPINGVCNPLLPPQTPNQKSAACPIMFFIDATIEGRRAKGDHFGRLEEAPAGFPHFESTPTQAVFDGPISGVLAEVRYII
jgi:hypothetical protein